MKLFDVYPLLPVTPAHALGAEITASNGKKYLDLYGGHAVISIGHSHPHYVAELSAQLQKIGFYSNAVQNPLQEKLAARLGEVSGLNEFNLFLCNSGAEANENALKLASFVNGRKKIIAFQGAFHGRTSAAVAATHDAKIVAPLNSNHEVNFLPLNDFDAATAAIDDTVCAVIIEGIQGVSGIHVPADDFLQHLRDCCSKHGALLILDEVQSGAGRSGTFFAFQQSGIRPDLVTMAKGLGNGFPVGAVLIAPEIEAKHGMLGTTFGGNYLACVAAMAVLDVLQNENLIAHANSEGEWLIEQLQDIQGIKSIRGRGLMLGIELDFPCAKARTVLLEEYQIFTGSAACKNTIRLLPPLNVSRKQLAYFVKALSATLSSVKQSTPVIS
ncbi:MAG: aminotransferase class III-fold pyridoxal phosphate-dependent enzyme [Bacteroidetes bacterium]|jgi:acetylornithine/N-succinyldiaminopimelate aminotransferase|nr:aminotransferase class III-fold pyridoxal phosphate-dependent enzyme [Bacteroidota bacterium]